MHKRRKVWETNRDMARRPKRVWIFCRGCDGSLLGFGDVCTRCGVKNYPDQRRRKK